ncbi:MAG: hypothetical protein GTO18_14125 [Anaerolineales bacterium]|nr:hypothetical protein [Anaerolineales bacterium]
MKVIELNHPSQIPIEDRHAARNWYFWLWLSPMLTVPTFTVILLYFLIMRLSTYSFSGGVGFDLIGREAILAAVFGSSLWHLILIIPAVDRRSFVRWHGLQALVLAASRVATPLLTGLIWGPSERMVLTVPVLVGLWFFGTWWGQSEAGRGTCTTMRLFGRSEIGQMSLDPDESLSTRELDPEELIEVIRHSRNPRERADALKELEKRGMVEPL